MPTHSARVHLNVVHADGADFYHTHMEETPPTATVLAASVSFRRAGTYLVSATWAVEAASLGVCINEYVSHAHGLPRSVESGYMYPLLQTSWVVTVSEMEVPPPASPSARWLWPRDAAESCAKDARPWASSSDSTGGNGGRATQGLLSFSTSYQPQASSQCCACANCSAAAGLCAGGQSSCMRLTATFETFEDECTLHGQPEVRYQQSSSAPSPS